VKALFKKQMTLEERIAPDTKYFHGIEKARNFARAHREPHYAIAVTQRHLLFMHIRKIVLQNNW